MFEIRDDHLIPIEQGQAVSCGWPGGRPEGVTWHWTATATLAECDELLGGATAARRGLASAHYGIGRSFDEGVSRYVGLDDRSWHAGKEQTLRWDGAPYRRPADKGSRTTLGVETVSLGYARPGLPAESDWIAADSPDGQRLMRVQPWTEEQHEMMVAIGREILRRWPEIPPRAHHGHHDLCPTYKVDTAGLPFARLLRDVYQDPAIPDVWTPLWTNLGRKRALAALGYRPDERPNRAWRAASREALERFQRDHGLAVDGQWTVFVSWKVWDVLRQRGVELAEVTA